MQINIKDIGWNPRLPYYKDLIEWLHLSVDYFFRYLTSKRSALYK